MENNHPAIIDKDMWELVQIEIKRRENLGAKYSSSDVFSSKLICADCGGFYGKKKWHSNTKYEKIVYQCNRKYDKDKPNCATPNLTETEIKKKFLNTYNRTMKDKERIINDLSEVIKLLTNTKELKIEIEKVNEEIAIVVELASKQIKDESKVIDNKDASLKYRNLKNRHEQLKTKLKELNNDLLERERKSIKLKAFLTIFKNSEDRLSEWNERIWMLMVESGTVYRHKIINFKFNNGLN